MDVTDFIDVNSISITKTFNTNRSDRIETIRIFGNTENNNIKFNFLKLYLTRKEILFNPFDLSKYLNHNVLYLIYYNCIFEICSSRYLSN